VHLILSHSSSHLPGDFPEEIYCNALQRTVLLVVVRRELFSVIGKVGRIGALIGPVDGCSGFETHPDARKSAPASTRTRMRYLYRQTHHIYDNLEVML